MSEEFKVAKYLPNSTISIHGGTENAVVGSIEIIDGQMRFTGDADAAALVFFNQCLKTMCDNYIMEHMVIQNVSD